MVERRDEGDGGVDEESKDGKFLKKMSKRREKLRVRGSLKIKIRIKEIIKIRESCRECKKG